MQIYKKNKTAKQNVLRLAYTKPYIALKNQCKINALN